MFDSSGAFRGVIAMDIQLGRISDLVSNIHAGKTGLCVPDRPRQAPDRDFCRAATRTWASRPDQLPLGASLDPSQLPTALPADFTNLLAKMSAGQGGLETISVGGTERFVLYRPVPDVDYSMGIIVPSSELLAGAIGAREQLAQVEHKHDPIQPRPGRDHPRTRHRGHDPAEPRLDCSTGRLSLPPPTKSPAAIWMRAPR